ncbi:MAG TPA: transcriptional regulator [Candidatus Dormibacteraeota bacterium]|jgi:predicted ArsR family transcriptional regulator
MSDPQAFRAALGRRLATYLDLRARVGPEAAMDAVLRDYTDRHRARMGPLIEGVPLVEGFARARPRFAALGFEQEVADVSTEGNDAVIEMNRECVCRVGAEACGLREPIDVLCELELEATRRAFPEMRATALHRQVHGASLCVFRYERPARSGPMEENDRGDPDGGL